MSAPPAKPRQRRVGRRVRRRDQLLIGMWFRRTSDGSVWQLRDECRREKNVQLAPDFGDGGPIRITRAELEHDYTRVAG